MKKIIFLLILISPFRVFCQSINNAEKMLYTCKVWGYMKYFHPSVSHCDIDWDSVLVNTLPKIKTATDIKSFNRIIYDMINTAGPVVINTGHIDTIAYELRRNLNYFWHNDTMLSIEIKNRLDSIQENFRPDSNCKVMFNNGQTTNNGLLIFPDDTLMYNKSTFYNFPDENTRLKILFKYWNLVKYFHPSNYKLKNDPDKIFVTSLNDFLNASDAIEFTLAIYHFTTLIEDGLAQNNTYNYQYFLFGGYSPEILVKYIEGNYVVIRSDITGINKGDVILEVSGNSIDSIESFYHRYLSAGNDDAWHSWMAQNLLSNIQGSTFNIKFKSPDETQHTILVTANIPASSNWFDVASSADSLINVKWTKFKCGVGYVNLVNISTSDINEMYNDLSSSKAIIFDLRTEIWDLDMSKLASLLFPAKLIVGYYMLPNPEYPGTFNWYSVSAGYDNNSNPYSGQIIILANSETSITSENDALILKAMPGAIIVGSNTRGNIGIISYVNLSQDITAGFSVTNVYNTNIEMVSKVGIKPDIVVTQTLKDLLNGKDDILDSALNLVCPLSVHENVVKTNIKVYPNPVTDQLNIVLSQAGNFTKIKMYDLTGKEIYRSDINTNLDGNTMHINFSSFQKGIYMVELSGKNGNAYIKVNKI